uniref:PDZ domain-containing protein n=1 Tax=Haemonchus contortus TaxID=6289 RepID=A0A7I4YLV3_HAECO
MVQLPADAPSPRLCIVEKNSPDQEYGYNLHAERGRGQFVGMVDKGSPADLGGLRMGDRIFAVNGHSIIGESHKKVVERIKENATRCEMLVISEEGAQWYQDHGIEINMQLPNIERVTRNGTTKANGSPPPAAGWYAPTTKATDPVFVAPPPPLEEPAMNKPRPRLCKLEKSSQSEEFGFNLHAEKGRGHFIGTVDQGGIGDRAGLRMGQRIVGVNGVLVYPNTPHKEVVAQIKRSPLRTTLLVASEDVDRWYKEHGAEFSFDYVEEEATNHHQQLSPHSANDVEHTEQIEVEEVHEDVADHEGIHDDSTKVVEPETEVGTGVQENESATGIEETVVTGEVQGDLLEAVFSALRTHTPVETNELTAEPELLAKTNEIEEVTMTARPASRTNSTHSSHESAVDVQQQSNYVPTYQSKRQNPPQVSPPSNGSSLNGYPTSTNSVSPMGDKFDIFGLSAQEARERLRQQKKNIHRGFDMSLEEKYRLVSNM